MECSLSLILVSVGKLCSQQAVYMYFFLHRTSVSLVCVLSKNTMEGHRWGCPVLWSLSWLSSSVAGLGELAERWSPTIPENSDGSNVPFFTFTSSFSRAAAPCWPPLTRFHFILLFWNHTFTWQETQSSKTSYCLYQQEKDKVSTQLHNLHNRKLAVKKIIFVLALKGLLVVVIIFLPFTSLCHETILSVIVWLH